MAGWVEVAIVHFRLWGRGDVVVVLAEQLGVCRGVVTGVGEDDGDGLVEEGKGVVQKGGEVFGTVDATICVGG